MPSALVDRGSKSPSESFARTVEQESEPKATTTARTALAIVALAAWGGLVWLTHVWGERLVHRDPASRIFAAPLVGRFDPRLTWVLLFAMSLAALAVFVGPRAATALPWRTLLWTAFGAAAAWAVALAATDGVHALIAPLTTPWDYLVDVPMVRNAHAFLGGFVGHADSFSTHVRAHPPGMLLLLWSMSRVGLQGAVPEAIVVIAAGASTVPAALVALREVSGETAARTAAPFMALLPAALWIATSADALFAGVGAWGVTLVVLATGRRGGLGDIQAIAGGLLLAAAAFLSYGLVLLWLVPVGVAMHRRALRPLVVAIAAAATVGLAFAAFGFRWTDGLIEAHRQYLHSAARARPQHYFWLGNLGALAVVLGPAIAVAMVLLRDRRAWLLAGAGLAMVALADASGLSKGEVERIWLPFVPWMTVAACALFAGRGLISRRWVRGLLAAQVVTSLVVQSVVRSPW